MKIAFLTSSYPRFAGDGAGTFIQSLGEAYFSLGHEVEVIAPYDPLLQPTSGVLPVHRFRYAPQSRSILGHGRALFADVRLKRQSYALLPGYLIASLGMLYRRHVARRFDFVHAHWLIPSGFVAAIGRRLGLPPFLATAHGSDVFLIEQSRLLRKTATAMLDNAEAISGVSADLIDRIAALGAKRRRLHVVAYGVDVDRFVPNPGSGIALRSKLDIPVNAKVVYAVGRLVYKKGFDIAIRSMPKILSDHPDAMLVICGSGDLQPELVRLAADLGVGASVRLAGHMPWDKAPGYYSMADVCVWPAVKDASGNVDGLPVSLLEGMACARPVVASRIAGFPAVIVDSVNGMLVPPANPVELASAVNTLLSDRRRAESLGSTAREFVKQRMTWNSIAEQYIELMRPAMASIRNKNDVL